MRADIDAIFDPAELWPAAAGDADLLPSGFPNSPAGRAKASAMLRALDARLIANNSATAALEIWCDDLGIALGAPVVAGPVDDAETPAVPVVRALLKAAPDERIVHRRVHLRRGAHVLSEADNWYLPSRLPEALNRALAETNASFGRVIEPLGFRRVTLASKPLWTGDDVLPAMDSPLPMPRHILQHIALLRLTDDLPLSLVVERYRATLLDGGGAVGG